MRIPVKYPQQAPKLVFGAGNGGNVCWNRVIDTAGYVNLDILGDGWDGKTSLDGIIRLMRQNIFTGSTIMDEGGSVFENDGIFSRLLSPQQCQKYKEIERNEREFIKHKLEFIVAYVAVAEVVEAIVLEKSRMHPKLQRFCLDFFQNNFEEYTEKLRRNPFNGLAFLGSLYNYDCDSLIIRLTCLRKMLEKTETDEDEIKTMLKRNSKPLLVVDAEPADFIVFNMISKANSLFDSGEIAGAFHLAYQANEFVLHYKYRKVEVRELEQASAAIMKKVTMRMLQC